MNEEEQFISDLQSLTNEVIRVFQLMDRSEKRRFDLTITQSYTLQNIQCCEKLTMNQLSERMGLATSTMTRIVDNLVRDGYIERLRDEGDRRQVHVTLTPKGNSLAEQLRARTRECFQKIVSNIPPEERPSVLRGYRIFLQALQCAYAHFCKNTGVEKAPKHVLTLNS